MKETNTANRLKEIMNEQNLKQIDILNKAKPYCKKYGVKLGKNDLSQYISGKVEPKQDKLSVLADTLNVSEAWLMGYDVPKYNKITKFNAIDGNEVELNKIIKNVSYKDIEYLIINDKENKILSYLSLYDILIYLYTDDNTNYIKPFIDMAKKTNQLYDLYVSAQQLSKALNKINVSIPEKIKQSLSSIKSNDMLFMIKKTKLLFFLRKKYNKNDLIKEIDKRKIFDLNIKEENKRCSIISKELNEMLDTINRSENNGKEVEK